MKFWSFVQNVRSRIWVGYALAVITPTLGYLVRIALGNLLIGYPFITFFLAIVITASVGTPGAAVLAMLLSAVLASSLAIDSGGSIFPQSTSAVVGLSFFIVANVVVILLVFALTKALTQLTATRQALMALNQELEERVAERTAELSKANAELVQEAAARQAAEAQARQAQKMEAIGQLTGGIAHDFNNMLAIVIGSLDIAKRRLAQGDTDILKFIDNAVDGATRGAALTHRLLAFSRQQALSPVVSDINALVRGMEDLLRRSLGETIKLEFVLAGGLWRTNVDPGQLENAILNLAVNARDAMPQGGQLTVETMNAHLDDAYARKHADVVAGQYVVVAVSDSGSGMPADVVERAFDPFFTTKALGEGTGLGLSQIHGFVKQSGGHVKIYTEIGQGTTIKIYMKRVHAEGRASSTETNTAELVMPLGSPTEIILVVEDEAGVREASVNSLRELGYTVRHAASGEQALKLLEQQSGIALLFTDVVMPGMSGRQLAEEVITRHGPTRVVYTTGYTSNAIVHNGVVDPGVELLSKPFTLDQLARKIRKALDAHVG
ncbi:MULTISPECIES: response regulator [unclassified Sphingobium]|uniref:response regulator n=1 Tax=unclassified Sphingobium TaxID=2611147 RepID=UPI001E3E8CD7|nr:response regulator [Sphingobium sp. CECT 9361]CAH0357149.1 Sensor histidine kinase RcsC [Sphingobium sp. CECT 9361]